MLFAAVLGACLLAEPLLEEQLKKTLIYGALVVGLLQIIRSWIRSGDFFSSLLSSILSIFLMPFIVIVLILFGAPVSMLQQETILASLHLTILAVQPLVSDLGLDSDSWFQALALQFPLTDVYTGSLGTVFGAWLGALPIALDWDRPWQTWPITILIGGYAGCAIGTILGGLCYKPDKHSKNQYKGKSLHQKNRKVTFKTHK